MRFTNLRRNEPQIYTAMIAMGGRVDSAGVSTGPGRWHGNDFLVRMSGHYPKVSCPGLVHRVDYDTDRVTIWVPRVGRPEWVKVGLGNTLQRGETEFDQLTFVDNPHSTTADWASTQRLYQGGPS